VDLFEELVSLVAELDADGVDYALAGGLAVAVWGAPRATKDIDLLVRPERVVAAKGAAARRGFSLPAAPLTFRDGMTVERVSRVADGALLTVDFLVVNPNLESAWQSRARFATERGPVWVISRDALIQMKLSAGRTQDVADIEALRELDR
jgi:hypothetical protein